MPHAWAGSHPKDAYDGSAFQFVYRLECAPQKLERLAMQEFLRTRSLALDGACAVIKQAQITRLADVNSMPSCPGNSKLKIFF